MPRTTSPPSRQRRTIVLSPLGCAVAKKREAKRVGSTDEYRFTSLSRNGTPQSGGSCSGRTRSISSASARAASNRSATTAFSGGFCFSIDAIADSVASRTERSRAAIRPAKSSASVWRSVLIGCSAIIRFLLFRLTGRYIFCLSG